MSKLWGSVQRRADEFYHFFLAGSELSEVFSRLPQAHVIGSAFVCLVLQLNGVVPPRSRRGIYRSSRAAFHRTCRSRSMDICTSCLDLFYRVTASLR